MESHRLGIKLFFATGSTPHLEAFLSAFHGWIQQKAIGDHLLIDVADYKHVLNGPGTVLVAHEANFSLDQTDGRVGLLYVRKQPCGNNFAERLQRCFAALLQAAQLIESNSSLEARFATNELIFRIYDRLLAPNTRQTYEEVEPPLRNFLAKLYGSDAIELRHNAAPETLFEVSIRTTPAPSITTLLNRLAAM